MADPPYTGLLGATRRETVFIPTIEGSARRVEIVRSINTVTDPTLARQCLDGTLHRHGDLDLAVPCIYHDPAARRFALVVPLARAHEELLLRAELLTRLSAETSELLPAYVREARTVLGAQGLRRWLDDVADHAERTPRRPMELVAREPPEAAQRAAALTAREDAVAQDEQVMRANMAALAARERMLRLREEALGEQERMLGDRVLGERISTEGPIDALPAPAAADDDEPMELDPDDGASLAPPPQDPLELQPDEVSAVDEEAPVTTAAAAPMEPAQWVAHRGRAYAAVVEGELRLWFQGGPDVAAALDAQRVTPVLQADPASALPQALLTLRQSPDNGVLTRVVLDVTRPEDRGVLEALARDFRVRVELVSPSGRALGTHALGAPCEPVAQGVLAALSSRAPGAADEREAEAARWLADGIGGATDALPTLDEQSLVTAESVAEMMARYEPLIDAERAGETALASGLGPAQLDSAARRLVLAALRCGVIPSAAYVQRAVSLGLAGDARALAARALLAYGRSVEADVAAIGRSRAEASRAWGPLLAWAASQGAPVTDAVRRAVAAVYDPDDPSSTAPPDPRDAPPPDAWADIDVAALADWATHPTARGRCARELARRDVARHARALAGVFALLPLDEAVAVAADLVPQGDALGDLWMELLSSRRAPLSTTAAVVAGALRFRRALTPLVQRTLAADNPHWRLTGWAAGEFGPALVRAVSRAESGDVERVAWMLAHAIRRGASRDVEGARDKGSALFTRAAPMALNHQEEARQWHDALRRGDGDGAVARAVAPLAALAEPLSTGEFRAGA